ncbi:MAG: chorismate mutase [Anaerolineae bacterium]|nr:chorismate mutase [Anaerolineae bacterium]
MIRGVRGATTVTANSAEVIISATKELLQAMIDANGIEESHVASVFFTTTPDLDAAFPAQAARAVGWWEVALLGAQEINCPDGVPMCIRVLMHWNTPKALSDIRHVYMHGAERLRPDMYPTNKIVIDGADEHVNG